MLTIATDQRLLIPRLCRRFSQATGWQLRFVPAGDPEDVIASAESPDDELSCWSSEINDGVETTGFLRLDPPERGRPETPFVLATDLAEGLAEVLGKLAAMGRRLEMRSRDASALVGAHAATEAHDHVGWALGHLLKSGVHLTNSRSAAFFLLSPDTNRLALRAAQHLDATSVPHPARELIASTPDLRALARQPVRFVAESDEPHEWLPSGCRSGLCVPVQSDKTPLGTLWMFDRRTHAYSHREEQVAAAIAVQIAGILERVTPPRDSDTWKRIEREVRIAAQGQGQWQLSRSSLPNDSRCEIAARCENCFELGGDLCELFALDADRLTIAIGDASGNSIPAAMIMAAVRGAVRTHVPTVSDLAGLISQMNRMLCDVTRSHQFMSLFYGVLDLHRRRLTYVNAGHPNPILFRQRQAIPLESHGMLLGVIKEAPYQAATVDVHPHDLLVLYSDGISETRDAARRMFRAEGIIAAVKQCVSPVADDVLHAIWTAASAHSDRAAQPDDRTVTVLRVLDR